MFLIDMENVILLFDYLISVQIWKLCWYNNLCPSFRHKMTVMLSIIIEWSCGL